MPVRNDLYVVLVGLHIAAAVVGFGAVAMSGAYGVVARRLDRPGALEESRRYFARPTRADAALLAVALLGLAALGVDPHGGGLARLWVSLALILWLLATVLLIRVVRPAEETLRACLTGGRSGPTLAGAGAGLGGGGGVDRSAATRPDPAPLDTATAAARRLARAAAASDVIFVVALGLMVFRPG